MPDPAPDPEPDPDLRDVYLAALRDAADLFRTDPVAAGAASVIATIEYVRAITDSNDRSLTTPLVDGLGRCLTSGRENTFKALQFNGKGCGPSAYGSLCGAYRVVTAQISDMLLQHIPQPAHPGGAVIDAARQQDRAIGDTAAVCFEVSGSFHHEIRSIESFCVAAVGGKKLAGLNVWNGGSAKRGGSRSQCA